MNEKVKIYQCFFVDAGLRLYWFFWLFLWGLFYDWFWKQNWRMYINITYVAKMNYEEYFYRVTFSTASNGSCLIWRKTWYFYITKILFQLTLTLVKNRSNSSKHQYITWIDIMYIATARRKTYKHCNDLSTNLSTQHAWTNTQKCYS